MDLPALKYWFTADTIWPLGSFALALWLGFFGIKNMISKWHFRAVAAAFALLAIFGWWSIARQARDTAETLARYDAMAGTIGSISKAVGVNGAAPTSSIKDAILSKIGEYQNEIRQNERTLADANAQISTRLDATQQQVNKQAPRDISDRQERILSRELSSLDGRKYNVLIISQASCLDCLNYSTLLRTIFMRAKGWNIANMNLIGFMNGAPSPGLTLVFPDKEKPSMSGLMIMKAFKKAGIPLTVAYDQSGAVAMFKTSPQLNTLDLPENAPPVELRIEPSLSHATH